MITKKNIFLIIFCVVTLIISACQLIPSNVGKEVSTDNGNYRVVTVQELQTMLENKDFTMVNVHIPFQGNISQTDLQLAYDEIEQNLNQLPQEKDAKILVYCLTSGMAKKAIATLLNQGYTNLWMLDGGTTSWEEAGLSLENKP